MRHRHRALITLNVLLLAAIAAVTFTPGATAQNAGDRPRGSYSITTGDLQGDEAAAIFIVDSANQEVVAMRYRPSNKALEGIDFAALSAPRGGSR